MVQQNARYFYNTRSNRTSMSKKNTPDRCIFTLTVNTVNMNTFEKIRHAVTVKTAASHSVNPLITTLKPYSNTVIGTLRCYIWYSEDETGRGCSPPRPLLPVPNVTAPHQRPAYQLRIIRCSIIIAFGV